MTDIGKLVLEAQKGNQQAMAALYEPVSYTHLIQMKGLVPLAFCQLCHRDPRPL